MGSVTSADGVTITYERSGSGPPLVLVHGSLSNGLVAWFAVKPLFDQNFTTHAIDRRGRRGTPETKDRSIELEAQDVASVIEAIGEPVFLLGHSHGGLCALGAASLVPDKVSKLILYEPPNPASWPKAAFQGLEDDAEGGDWDGFVYRFLRDVIEVPLEQLDQMRGTPFFQPLVDDAQASLADFRAVRRFVFQPEAYGVPSMPVLMLVGEKSVRPDLYVTDILAPALPNVTITQLPCQDHIAHILDAVNTANTIKKFLVA